MKTVIEIMKFVELEPFLFRLVRCAFAALLLAVTVMITGCATRAYNAPLDASNADTAYTFLNRLPHNSPKLFVVLTFSGGGTRAAAFALGVLNKLSETRIMVGGQSRRLLDEVDVITSVSGGSFTAAYYGLFGDRVFTDFPEKFLYQDIQREMISRLLSPTQLIKVAAPPLQPQ